jgi:hypothetical protein
MQMSLGSVMNTNLYFQCEIVPSECKCYYSEGVQG